MVVNDVSGLIFVALVLFVTALAVAGGVWWLGRMRPRGALDPLAPEKSADDVAYEWAVSGVVGAYQLSERALTEMGVKLRGADKKELVLALYEKLPPWVTAEISEAVFGLMVEQVVASGLQGVEVGGEQYKRLFAEWERAARAHDG